MLSAEHSRRTSPALNTGNSDEALLFEREQRPQGAVYRLSVNRPDRLNVLDTGVLEHLRAALADIDDDRDARAVVLRGAGAKAWIGGADIREMAGLDAAGARAFITRLHDTCDALRALAVPVIARIEGFCLGAGLEVAACCDLRIASEASRFGMPEVQVGLPSVIEAAVLPRLIGSGRTRDLVLTGRIVEAREALAWGLVESVVAPERLDELLEERLVMILNAAPRALRLQKALCRQWEALPLDAAIAAGIDAFERAYESDEAKRYMRRFLDRPRKRADDGGN